MIGRLGLALIVTSVAASPAFAQSAATLGTLSILTVSTAPSLDPKADAAEWKDVPPVTLQWDVQHQRRSSELTTARLTTDGTSVLARFDVQQRETLLQAQQTNNVGDGTDDEVWVDFWPSGNRGFYY